MKIEKVRKAAKEFNKVVELETPVNVKEADLSVLCKELYEALEYKEDEDVFTPKTLKTFEAVKAQIDAEKSSKENTVEVGTTVELDADTNEIKKVSTMKNVELLKVVLDPKVGKDQLVDLIKSEKAFKAEKKTLLKITNFMSLKKAMRECFDADEVAKVKATMPKVERKPKAKKLDPLTEAITNAEKDELKSISKENEKFEGFEWKKYKKDVEAWREAMLAHIAPKAKEKKEKVVKLDPETEKLVNSVKSATKVKQLKKIAKEDGRFAWKELKKMDFEAMQTNMLNAISCGDAPEEKAKPEPKMVPNPLMTEIEAFGKTKKLIKWAKEKGEPYTELKLKKSMDLEEAKGLAFSVTPHEIEEKKKRSTSIRNMEERKAFIEPLIETGKYTRPELNAMLIKEFPGQEKAHSNMLSECKNEKYNRLSKLVVEKKGKYRFAK